MAAHGAEVGVDVEVLVVVRARRVGVEAQLEVLLPVERGAGLGELVVAVARAGDAERHIRRVRSDLVGDAALLDVVLLGKAQVLLGRHVAEHAGTVVAGGSGADAAGDVVVAREDVGDERAKHVEGRAVAQRALQLHVVFDLVERNVARALDHHLHAHAPGALREHAERLQFRQLRAVGGVGESARAQAVADGEGHVVAAHHLADPLPAREHRVLLVVHQHPLGQQAAAAADDADEALLDEGQVLAQDARVDGEVVHALLRLVLERLEDHLLVEVLDLAADDHRVDRHRADGHRAVADEGVAALVQVAAGGEVHHRVGAPLLGPLQLLDFLVGSARNRRCAHVGVDLGL